MKISWTGKKSNWKVLNMVQESRQIIKTIETSIIRFIEHVMWHNKFIIIIVERKVYEKRGRGRPADTNQINIKINYLSSVTKR